MIDQRSILVVGKTGQLAQALKQVFPHAIFVGRPEFDIAHSSTYNTLPHKGICHIINASAYTQVDLAETSEGRQAAWDVNAHGVQLLSRYAAEHACTLTHISTDYVFDGSKPEHTERELVAPLNVYGQSKAAGELAVGMLPKHYILRTQWLVGTGSNFINTMLRLGMHGTNPSVVNDQTGRLTFTHTLSEAIAYLLIHQPEYGTYHVSNTGPVVSWAEIAQLTYSLAKLSATITPVTTQEYYAAKPFAAKRPLHCAFDLRKLLSTGFTPTDWRTELAAYVPNQTALLYNTL